MHCCASRQNEQTTDLRNPRFVPDVERPWPSLRPNLTVVVMQSVECAKFFTHYWSALVLPAGQYLFNFVLISCAGPQCVMKKTSITNTDDRGAIRSLNKARFSTDQTTVEDETILNFSTLLIRIIVELMWKSGCLLSSWVEWGGILGAACGQVDVSLHQ